MVDVTGGGVVQITSGVHDIADMNGPVPRLSPPGDPSTGAGPGVSFKRRKIDVLITLANAGAAFTEAPGGENTATLSGLRVYAAITHSGGTGSEATIRILGMTDSHMNQLSLLGLKYAELQTTRNIIRLRAGEVPVLTTGAPAPPPLPGEALRGPVLSDVFSGTINTAYQSFQSMPDVSFEINARIMLFDTLNSAEPTTYYGEYDAVLILANLATKMRKNFKNWGVPPTMLHNPYYANTLYDQAQKVAQAANIYITPNETSDMLEIWPVGGQRGPPQIPVVSPDTGMIGYPIYSSSGLIVKTLFNPLIRFGARVQIRSSIKQRYKDGIYSVGVVSHSLMSEVPGGEWFTSFECRDPTSPNSPGNIHG